MSLKRVKQIIVMTISCFTNVLVSDNGWTTPAPIDPAAEITGDVFLVYNANLQQTFATWRDPFTSFPIFSQYTATWSSSAAISNEAIDNYTIFTSYDSSTQQVFAAWSLQSLNPPRFSSYLNSWGPAGSMSATSTAPFRTDVALSYNIGHNQMIALWPDPSKNIVYSKFTGGVWGPASTLPTIPQVNSTIATTYNSAAQTTFAAWADAVTSIPNFAIYNGISWTHPAPINNTFLAQDVLSLAYNATTNTVFAAWFDTSNIYIAQYVSGIWQAPVVFQGSDVGLAYESTNGRIFAVWRDQNGHPTFAIYDGTWSTPLLIDSTSQVDSSVYLSYDPDHQQMFAAWAVPVPLARADSPAYSIFDVAVPVPPVLVAAVTHLAGTQCINNFGLVTERFNHITWQPGQISGLAGFRVYRNGTRIATLPSDAISYDDHNRTPGVADTYTVIAFNPAGTESSPATLTIT